MALTPKNASDILVNQLWETLQAITKEHAEQLKADPTLAARLDADPELQSVHADRLLAKIVPAKAELDLRGREFDIRYEYHGMFRGKQQWTCWDHKTYDGEESHLGFGESKEDALCDYLEKIQGEGQGDDE